MDYNLVLENIEDLIKKYEIIEDKGMICVNYECALYQRQYELSKGLGLNGTNGFEKTGCYDCNGINTLCKKYMPRNILYGE
jgi:hypothetical protein